MSQRAPWTQPRAETASTPNETEGKKKKKVLQSLILGARFSSHSPDIFEDSL